MQPTEPSHGGLLSDHQVSSVHHCDLWREWMSGGPANLGRRRSRQVSKSRHLCYIYYIISMVDQGNGMPQPQNLIVSLIDMYLALARLKITTDSPSCWPAKQNITPWGAMSPVKKTASQLFSSTTPRQKIGPTFSLYAHPYYLPNWCIVSSFHFLIHNTHTKHHQHLFCIETPNTAASCCATIS